MEPVDLENGRYALVNGLGALASVVVKAVAGDLASATNSDSASSESDSCLGLPFSGCALRGATTGLFGATTKLMTVEISGHSYKDLSKVKQRPSCHISLYFRLFRQCSLHRWKTIAAPQNHLCLDNVGHTSQDQPILRCPVQSWYFSHVYQFPSVYKAPWDNRTIKKTALPPWSLVLFLLQDTIEHHVAPNSEASFFWVIFKSSPR